jgi:hypothetical protein
MYKPGIMAGILVVLLVIVSGCALLSTTPAIKSGITDENSVTETPTLPDQYTARGLQSDNRNMVMAAVVTTRGERPDLQSAVQIQINGTGLGNSSANATKVQIIEYLTHDQDYTNSSKKSEEINFWNTIASDIDKKIDGGNNITVSFARLHISHGGTYDSVGIQQVSDFWDYLMSPPPTGWTYVNDPLYSDETFWDYLSSASDSITNGLKGDCDDFAILNAALVEAIGGNSRVVYAANSHGAHMYAEAQFIPGVNITTVIQNRYNLSGQTVVHTHPGNWLNLDWFDYPARTTHPGGNFYDDEGMIWVIYKDGHWEKQEKNGITWITILEGPL